MRGFPVYSCDVVGLAQSISDVRVPELCLHFRWQRHPDPHNRTDNVLASDSPNHCGGRVRVSNGHGNVHRDEPPGIQPMKIEVGQPLALRCRRVQIDDAKAFIVALLGKVHALEATGIGHERILISQDLMLVDVAKRHVIDLGPADVASQQHVVLSQHHGTFSAHGGSIDRDVAGQYGGNIRVQALGPSVDSLGHPVLDRLPYLFDGQTSRLFPAQYPASSWPGDSQNLQRAGLGRYGVVLQVAPNLQVRHLQGLEYLHCRCPADCVGKIMIANQ